MAGDGPVKNQLGKSASLLVAMGLPGVAPDA